MASVKLTNVKKIYDNKVVAVHDFNLDIKDKEFIVFVGPSGCGKSTTLRMVAGLEEISDGTVEIDGEVVNDLQPKDRNIAMVFQNYALYPHFTVYENMAFPLRLNKNKKVITLNDEEIEECKKELDEVINKKDQEIASVTAKYDAKIEKALANHQDEVIKEKIAALVNEKQAAITQLNAKFDEQENAIKAGLALTNHENKVNEVKANKQVN